jgi:hypothetical protein
LSDTSKGNGGFGQSSTNRWRSGYIFGCLRNASEEYAGSKSFERLVVEYALTAYFGGWRNERHPRRSVNGIDDKTAWKNRRRWFDGWSINASDFGLSDTSKGDALHR